MSVANWPDAKRSLDAYDLSGKRALVAGAAAGAGRAIALALAEAGADLAIVAPNAGDAPLALRKTAKEARAFGRNVIDQATDVSSGQGAQVMVKQVVKELGGIDIVVNAPDLMIAKPVAKTSDADWAKVVAGNLSATFFVCRAAGRELLRDDEDAQARARDSGRGSKDESRARGRVINVASVLGERGLANAAAYCAAQGGILNLTRALAQEWAARGITVNAIAQGWMEDSPALGDLSPEANQTVRFIPMKRAGRSDEVAPLAVYLASDSAGYVTGQTFFVDGGLTVHL